MKKSALLFVQVHVYTLRNEDRYLAWDFAQDVRNAYDFYLSLRVDGIFTDFPHSLVSHLDLTDNGDVSAAMETRSPPPH